MVRYIIDTNAQTIEDLKGFNYDGYAFDSNLSPKDLEAVERLSKGIVAKLLHGPMNHLRQQKEGDATRVAIEQVKEAFLLEE